MTNFGDEQKRRLPMKKTKLAALLFILILTVQPVSALSFGGNTLIDDFAITTRRIKSKLKRSDKTLPEEKWNNLRTTFVPGVYCQQVDDYGQYRRQRHFFYNTEKHAMIEIPKTYHVSSPKDLRYLEKEYTKYSNKSDTFTHNGKQYKIPTMR